MQRSYRFDIVNSVIFKHFLRKHIVIRVFRHQPYWKSDIEFEISTKYQLLFLARKKKCLKPRYDYLQNGSDKKCQG